MRSFQQRALDLGPHLLPVSSSLAHQHTRTAGTDHSTIEYLHVSCPISDQTNRKYRNYIKNTKLYTSLYKLI